MPKKHLYIDADMLVYTMGYATESKLTWADGSVSKVGSLADAKRIIQRSITHYLKTLKCLDFTLVMSGKGNWRFDIFPQYKANRVVLVKPIYYNDIRKWLKSRPDCVETEGEEADDYLARVATTDKAAIIVSADKDFHTVPGQYYHLSSKRLYRPDPAQTVCFLLFQALSGDLVDGYSGVKWLGKAKTMRLLKAFHKQTIRATYLGIKRQVLKRGGRSEWLKFRVCLDLASLTWKGETGGLGVGLRRIWKLRGEPFTYRLPYYDVAHNLKYGKPR